LIILISHNSPATTKPGRSLIPWVPWSVPRRFDRSRDKKRVTWLVHPSMRSCAADPPGNLLAVFFIILRRDCTFLYTHCPLALIDWRCLYPIALVLMGLMVLLALSHRLLCMDWRDGPVFWGG
jgi:hypothetical protein